MNKAGGGNQRGDQAVDGAHADRASVPGPAQDLVELGVGEGFRHAASSSLRRHAHEKHDPDEHTGGGDLSWPKTARQDDRRHGLHRLHRQR